MEISLLIDPIADAAEAHRRDAQVVCDEVLRYALDDLFLIAPEQLSVPLLRAKREQTHHAFLQTDAEILSEQATEGIPGMICRK